MDGCIVAAGSSGAMSILVVTVVGVGSDVGRCWLVWPALTVSLSALVELSDALGGLQVHPCWPLDRAAQFR
jgi:hypothetical protein